jgi:type I restriction enzyme S subunit
LYSTYNTKINKIYSYSNISSKNLKFSKGGEVLVPRVGEDPLDFANCSYLPFKNVAIGEMISVYNTKENPFFICLYFNAKLRIEFAKVVEGANVSNLYFRYLEPIKIKIPNSNEQQKIGEFFNAFDERINNQQKLIKSLEKHKKALMQKIFACEIRFKDENGNNYPDWQQKKLGDMFDINTASSKAKFINEKGKYYIMDMGSISKTGENISHKRTDNQNNILSFADLVMPKDDIGGGQIIGRTAYIDENDKYVLSDHTYCLKPKEQIEAKFYHFLMNSFEINKKMKRLANGTAQLGLSSKDIIKLQLIFPTLEEQQKIAQVLTECDNNIENEKQKLEKLKQYKKALLQQMLI